MVPLNETPFQLAWMVGKTSPPQWSATVLIKGSFRLSPGGTAVPEPESLALTGDKHLDDDPAKLLLYPSDFVYTKPRADLLLVGTYHAPGGKATDVGAAAFRVGSWSKRVAVIGDREWGAFFGQSAPRPLKSLPLTYEHAFGGPGYEKNPLGRGVADVVGPGGKVHRPLPNLERPERLIAAPGDRVDPAGFGPLPGTWPQRMSKSGSFGKKWLASRWPWYPEDFDWSYFNAAPEDQQVSFLKGDEELVFENLHPAHARYACRLPGLRLRCFLQERVKASLALREVTLRLDTLWADMDAERLVLVWRGQAPVRSQKLDEILHLFVTPEPLKDPPRSAEACASALEEAVERADEDEEELEPEEPEDEEAPEAEAEAEPEEAEEPTPTAAAPEEPEPAEEAEEPELPEEPPPPTRDEILARLARKESFAGADLSGADLRLLDLSGIDFTEAVLANASLVGAALAGSNFSGAGLEGADLSLVKAAGAVFAGADLAAAWLQRADLSGANLTGADLSAADLSEAVVAKAVAVGAILVGADLSGADFTEANLESADLGGCRLHGTVLNRANLTAAQLAGAWGRQVRAEGAVVQKLKAADATLTDGIFRGVKGEESVWQSARLTGCDFRGAVLPGAEFSAAHLGSANLSGGDFREGTFDEAILTRATAVRANFLAASMQKADLALADFRESNLYETTCWDALAEEAVLEGANLKMAKFGKKA
jgi:uncharacterized protein YjbI with pentapeptide repeats